MTPRSIAVVLAAAAAVLARPARADVVVAKGEDFQVNAGFVAQALGFGQRLDDPYRADDRMYLFMKQARARGSGFYDGVRFEVELALGGEAGIATQTGVQLSMLNANVSIPLSFLGQGAYVKVGQFKVPYSREQLTYDAYSQLLERSINDLAFRIGYDVGVALTVKPGPLTMTAGVFTGGGRDVPPNRYLPESLGIPQVVGRVGVGDVDEDEYLLRNDPHPDRARVAFFVSGLYTKDTTVGHSSVLNVKLADKSLLLNANWNPYIGQSPLSKGEWWQAGADAALRLPLDEQTAVSAELEGNWGGYSNAYGVLHMAGARAQAGLTWRRYEVAARYAVVVPDQNFANGGVQLTGSKPIHEITPSATWYVNGQHLKLVADLPVLIHTPVFTEKNVGSYVGLELPDQTTVVPKGGTATRQNIVEARLMLQAAF